MSFELNALKEWAKTGRLHHDEHGNTVFDGHLIIQGGNTGPAALPKELAKKYGFVPKVNQHGARTNAYSEKVYEELMATRDPIDRKIAERLYRRFSIEDELNNPPPGSPERATLDRNRHFAVSQIRVNVQFGILQDTMGQVIPNHAYYWIGNAETAEDRLAEFIEHYDEHVRMTRAYVEKNNRI